MLWSEWFNRSFTLGMSEEIIKEHRGSEYEPLEEEGEPRILSIKKMLDSSTFSKMRKRI